MQKCVLQCFNMKFIALVSGGKDSVYAVCKLLDQGDTLVALVHIITTEEYSDSYMYQTVGSEVAVLHGECFDVPIYTFKSRCKALNLNIDYTECDGDEVEDLYNAVRSVLQKHTAEAVSTGAILSVYQKNRVENVCKRLGLQSLSPLWGLDQRQLLQDMIQYGIEARIMKIASASLEKRCLGMSLSEVNAYMDGKNYRYGMNYCGEGGEYETVVFDCKHFKSRITGGVFETHGHPDEKDKDGGVFFMTMNGHRVQEKSL